MKRYYITTSITNISFLNKLKVKKLQINDDQVSFFTDRESYLKLQDQIEINVQDLRKDKLLIILKKHLISIIGCLLIALALINQSISVVAVRFSYEDTYNPEIVDYLEQYYHKVGPFRYLNDNLTNINYNLRSEFYQYEWIGLRKVGSFLYIDIKQINNPPKVDDQTPGSYYAKYDGIVKKYHIEKGVVVVQEEQYVAKGELLISGKITHYNNEIENTRAIGYVIAEVLQYKDYQIPKYQTDIERSGKIEKITRISLFGKAVGKKNTTFSHYELEETLNYNFLNIFQKKTIYAYEIKSISKNYTSEEAILYAKSLFYKEFINQKVNKFEKIIFNNLVKIEEDDECFYIRLLVKTYQNIAEFKEY